MSGQLKERGFSVMARPLPVLMGVCLIILLYWQSEYMNLWHLSENLRPLDSRTFLWHFYTFALRMAYYTTILWARVWPLWKNLIFPRLGPFFWGYVAGFITKWWTTWNTFLLIVQIYPKLRLDWLHYNELWRSEKSFIRTCRYQISHII